MQHKRAGTNDAAQKWIDKFIVSAYAEDPKDFGDLCLGHHLKGDAERTLKYGAIACAKVNPSFVSRARLLNILADTHIQKEELICAEKALNEFLQASPDGWFAELASLYDMDGSLMVDESEFDKRQTIIERQIAEQQAHAWAQKGTIFERQQELIKACNAYAESIILQLKSLEGIDWKRINEVSPFVDLLYLHAQQDFC